VLSILHISDIHFDDRDPLSLKRQIEREIIEKNLMVNFVVCSGDFTFKYDFFDKAEKEFKGLLDSLHLEKDKILFTPGNHEICRIEKVSSDSFDSFAKYRQFLMKFYTIDEKNKIYGANWDENFSSNNFTFHYSPNEDILFSGYHRESHEICRINNDIIYSTPKSDHPIKIAILHETIIPLLDLTTEDIILNAGYFVRVLSNSGYKLFLNGHAHRPEVNLINNKYLSIASGSLKINSGERNYNIIRLDKTNVYVETYKSDKYPSSKYELDIEKAYEISKSGIFHKPEMDLYEINIKELINLKNKTKTSDPFDILIKDTDYNASDFIYLRNVQVLKSTMFRLSVLFNIQLDTLVKLLKDKKSIYNSKKLFPGVPNENQIYIKNLESENIVEDEIVKNFCDIRIYDVEFRQEDTDGRIKQKPGKYVTIKPASEKHGAVILPIDDEGKVLLVNQFRHSTFERKFFTEAIRGFSDFDDDTSLITALREFSEEGGGPKIEEIPFIGLEELLRQSSKQKDFINLKTKKNMAIKSIYYLGHSYTDTGKLWEAPRYYLFHVNNELQSKNITRKDPIMTSPFWVKFKYVLESIVKNEAIQLEAGEIVDVFHSTKNRPNKFLYKDKLILENKIFIEDSFTKLIIFLSIPKLKNILNADDLSDIYSVIS